MSEPDTCDCKIGRNVRTYALGGLDDEIRQRRLEQGESLRDLADHVNVRILEAAIDPTDADVAGDARSVYVALTDEDVEAKRRVTVQDRLTKLGIDVDELAGRFVSYQSVRHHLRNCLGMDTGRSGIESIQEGRDVITWSQDRHLRTVERSIDRLRREGVLVAGSFEVNASVTVTCTDCGTTRRVLEFLDANGCDCQP